MTPPPTETPAPLSDLELVVLLANPWSGDISASLARRLYATISTLRARNEAHVAALQEIGRGAEADQATIARLSEELAQADAVIADEDGDVLMEDRILWRNQAIARHVARRSAGEGREG